MMPGRRLGLRTLLGYFDLCRCLRESLGVAGRPKQPTDLSSDRSGHLGKLLDSNDPSPAVPFVDYPGPWSLPTFEKGVNPEVPDEEVSL